MRTRKKQERKDKNQGRAGGVYSEILSETFAKSTWHIALQITR